jgi:hypothetical protein
MNTWNRLLRWALSVGCLALLGGCASLRTVTSDVSAYSQWPAGRAAGTYSIEVLPSQASKAKAMQELEAAARPALEAAGFKPAEPGTLPDVRISLGARVSVSEPSIYDDPWWWQGGVYRYRGRLVLARPWPYSATWHDPRLNTSFEREVAVLIRDRASSEPLYEVRAVTEGFSSDLGPFLRAMFAAALKDFPVASPEPRRVSIELQK